LRVHRTLGPGLLKAIYQQCLARELRQTGIAFESQVPIAVRYKGRLLDFGYRADIIVEGQLLLEIKSVEHLLPIHTAQLLTYVKLAHLGQGLMNFNSTVLKDGLRSVLIRRALEVSGMPPRPRLRIHSEGVRP
jgi:GxxExxY protein